MMNPAYNPAEVEQLQCRYEGPPGGPMVTQYTTVSMPSDPFPNDHVVWSLFCFVNGNPCCLGLAALIFSFKARDRKVAGDLSGARSYASTARNLNICSTVLVSMVIIILFIVIFMVIAQITRVRYNHNYRF